MSRFKLILLGVLSVFAVSVASATSALAAEEEAKEIQVELCSGSTFSVLCLVLSKEPSILWAQEQNGFFKFKGHIKPATKSTFTVEGGPNMQCSEAPSTFQLNTTTELLLLLIIVNKLIEFKSCKIINSAETEANCVVKEPIVTKAEGSVDVPENDVVVKQIGTEPFASITIKSAVGKTCIFAKENQKATGEQLCELLLPEIEEDKVFHLLRCLNTGSNLKYAEKPAKFFLEDEGGLEKEDEGKPQEWDLSTGP